jgi:hypothetical protein
MAQDELADCEEQEGAQQRYPKSESASVQQHGLLNHLPLHGIWAAPRLQAAFRAASTLASIAAPAPKHVGAAGVLRRSLHKPVISLVD